MVFEMILGIALLAATVGFLWESLKQWGVKYKNEVTKFLLDRGWIRAARKLERFAAFCIKWGDKAKYLYDRTLKAFTTPLGEFLIGVVGEQGGRHVGRLAFSNALGEVPSEVKKIISREGKYVLDLSDVN